MFKKILVGVVVILALFAVVVSFQSPDYVVTRTAVIAAPPSVPFALVNDFHSWDSWSPWAKLDPTMKVSFGGPPSGPGAEYSWVGDSKVGEGRMAILSSQPGELVDIRLDFIKPMAGTNDCLFKFAPQAGGTQVTWTMSGKKNFVSKAVCMFMDMDKMIGGDFERGLANLKTVAERK